MTLENLLLQSVNDLGIVGLLLVIIIGGLRGFWVWGWLYREEQRDKNEWKAIALQALGITEKVVQK